MSAPSSQAPKRRKLSSLQLHLIAAAAVAALALFAGLLHGNADSGAELGPLPWIAIAAALIIGGVIALAAWRRLDEAAKEAHKWAWYWGATAGMLAALVVLLMDERGVRLAGRLGLFDTLEDGVILALGLELIGYIIAWCFWWLRRR